MSEQMPDRGGRPAIGPKVSINYPDDLLTRIDAAAAASDMTRAAWLRQAAEAQLASHASGDPSGADRRADEQLRTQKVLLRNAILSESDIPGAEASVTIVMWFMGETVHEAMEAMHDWSADQDALGDQSRVSITNVRLREDPDSIPHYAFIAEVVG